MAPRSLEPGEYAVGRPWIVSGTVVSFDREFLADRPFRDEMFWLEMSAWALDYGSARFQILGTEATHKGFSTRGHAAWAVHVSEFSARCAFVTTFGGRIQRNTLLPVLVYLHIVSEVMRMRLSRGQAVQLMQVYLGRKTWQQCVS
jgi:hypothetical protein